MSKSKRRAKFVNEAVAVLRANRIHNKVCFGCSNQCDDVAEGLSCPALLVASRAKVM